MVKETRHAKLRCSIEHDGKVEHTVRSEFCEKYEHIDDFDFITYRQRKADFLKKLLSGGSL